MHVHTFVIALFMASSLCTVVQGQILNGTFEIPDLERPNVYYDPPLYPPLYWDWYDTPENLNYVALHNEFTPSPEQGQTVTWSIPEPVEGEYFVLLSTGDARGPRSWRLTEYSRIEQIIEACPGDVISGYYYFGTCDYLPYNDTGTVQLTPVDPNDGLRTIILVSESVSKLGSYQSTDGWQFFQHQFSDESCGEYVISCEVRDVYDRGWKSYLALDAIRLCRGVPPAVDLNFDCTVDYLDFNVFAASWLADCSDPNVIIDPNIPCAILIPDPNTPDKIIDIDNLLPITEHWLENYNL